jgi:hypothetical protein
MTSSKRFALILACLSGALLYGWIELTWTGNRGADFNQFRAAATLAGTGRLYNYASISAEERKYHERVIAFGRFPFFAAAFKPIAALRYGWGRVAWWTVNVLALAGFAILWPFRARWRAAALFWSCPAWMLLNYGQDTALFLFLGCGGMHLLAVGHELAAGLVLSLCASKFHLALAIPVFLAAGRRWRALAGGLIGGLMILAISFAVEGPGWPSRLLDLSGRPDFNPALWRMPNVAGLVQGLPFALPLELALAAVVMFAVWRISRGAPVEIGMMAALAAGLLLSHHAQAYDCVLLLPALFYVVTVPCPRPLRFLAFALLTPLPYLYLLDERLSLAGRLMVTGFPLALLALLALPRKSGIAAAEIGTELASIHNFG